MPAPRSPGGPARCPSIFTYQLAQSDDRSAAPAARGPPGDRATARARHRTPQTQETPPLAGPRRPLRRAIPIGYRPALTFLCCTGRMAKPPRRLPPQKRKSDLAAEEAVSSRAIIPRTRDSRQAGIIRRAAPALHPAAAGEARDRSAGRRALGARAEVRWIQHARAHRSRKSAAHHRAKRVDAPYGPGDRSGSWLKIKCLNREEFIVVGWTDPEGTRPHLGALLLAYHAPDGPLVYAGRAGTGISVRELARLSARLKPLASDRMPLDVRPPRGSCFGSPLVLLTRALGSTGARGRGDGSGMDGRRSPTPSRLSGSAKG